MLERIPVWDYMEHNFTVYSVYISGRCISFFNITPVKKKDAICQIPSWKKKAVMFKTVMMRAYQDQLNLGFPKVCEILKVHGTEPFKCLKVFSQQSVIVGTFPHPLRMTQHKS